MCRCAKGSQLWSDPLPHTLLFIAFHSWPSSCSHRWKALSPFPMSVNIKDMAVQFRHHHAVGVLLSGLHRGCPCAQPWFLSLSKFFPSSHYSLYLLWTSFAPP